MKKNKMMRLASVLLVAVLMSTCAISGTFAKYVTKGTATSTARVAKFGVKVAADGALFSTTYATKNEADIAEISANSVISSDDKNVVAPGTSGSLTETMITGKPEVAVRVTNEATVTLNDKWFVEGTFYCPIIIKVNDTTIDGKDYSDANSFASAVKTAIDGVTAEYEPNTDLGNLPAEAAKGLSVSWEWPFEINNEDGSVNADIDKKDTALGDAAAGIPTGAQAANITIAVTTTVTQID